MRLYIDAVVTDDTCISVQDDDVVLLLTYRHDGLVVDTKPAKAATMVSMGVRRVTENGGLYTIDYLAVWAVIPIPSTADDLLRGPFALILSAINASIADSRFPLDSVVIPNDVGEAIAKAIRDGTALATNDGSSNLVTSIGSPDMLALNISASGEKVDEFEAVNWEKLNNWRIVANLLVSAGSLPVYPLLSSILTSRRAASQSLDGESALNQSKGTWPLSISQSCFDML